MHAASLFVSQSTCFMVAKAHVVARGFLSRFIGTMKAMLVFCKLSAAVDVAKPANYHTTVN